MKVIDRIGEHLANIIAFDTVSSKSNLPLIEYAADRYSARGCDVIRIDDPKQPKANLIVTLGTLNQPPLVLSGHADVVPVEGQAWSRDPFTLYRDVERWYGRGACDMKGFLAVCMVLFDEWIESPPPIPVQLVISYDEEIGCQGVISAVEYLSNAKYPPRLCIVGEPTELHVVNQHKSNLSARVKAVGISGHSSDPDSGVNAIQHAARVINFISDLDSAEDAQIDPAFSPSRSTFHCGRFDGGVILNIIPEHAQFDFEIRGLPALDIKQLIAPVREAITCENARMAKKNDNASIELEVVNSVGGLMLATDHPMTQLCIEITGDAQPHTVSYATEAGIFHQYGIDTLVMGPGNIGQAHRPDEWIDPAQLTKCYHLLKTLASRLAE